jgi:hypothetical protein
MNKKLARYIARAQQGQSMIIIAVVVVGLIAVLGLAIDGGNLFLQRRNMQNAADAAALAGTRMLAEAINTCHADPVGADAVVASEVNKYAEENGVNDTNGIAGDPINANVVAHYVDRDGTALGLVGGGHIPNGATGVEVNIANTHKTFFIGLVGMDQATVTSYARAMTGPITQFPGGGLLPIALHVDVVNELPVDRTIRILDVINEHSGGQFCVDQNGNGRYQDEGIDVCIGDTTASNAHRGWLNLNYIYNSAHLAADDFLNRSFEQNVPNRGCGPDPARSTDDGLQGWATRDACPYPYPVIAGGRDRTNGDFIHGSPGARQSTLDAVEETFENQIGYVPLFDHIYMSDWMAEHMTAPEEPNVEGASLGGDHWPRSGGGGSAFLYHVVGFTAVKVYNVDRDAGNEHYIDAAFKKAIIGDGVFLPGTGFNAGGCQPTLVYGVSLWE